MRLLASAWIAQTIRIWRFKPIVLALPFRAALGDRDRFRPRSMHSLEGLRAERERNQLPPTTVPFDELFGRARAHDRGISGRDTSRCAASEIEARLEIAARHVPATAHDAVRWHVFRDDGSCGHH